jgi:hypothetical protein
LHIKKQLTDVFSLDVRRVWRYQRGNQNPYIEEQTIQWPKEKVQKDKQLSTKHTYKTEDRRVSSSCFTSGTRRFNLVSNPNYFPRCMLSNVWIHPWPGRLSTTKHVRIPKQYIWNYYPCTEKKFIDLNPSGQELCR